jgi:hypothetical protein
MYSIPGGIGIAIGVYLPPEKRNEKILALLGGISLLGYGVYKAYKESGVTPPPVKHFPTLSESPTSGYHFACLMGFSFRVNVTNPYTSPESVWAGLSVINETGEIVDYPATKIDMQPKTSYYAEWSAISGCIGGTNRRCRFGVWDVEPKPGVTIDHLVGDTGWIPFTVGLI